MNTRQLKKNYRTEKLHQLQPLINVINKNTELENIQFGDYIWGSAFAQMPFYSIKFDVVDPKFKHIYDIRAYVEDNQVHILVNYTFGTDITRYRRGEVCEITSNNTVVELERAIGELCTKLLHTNQYKTTAIYSYKNYLAASNDRLDGFKNIQHILAVIAKQYPIAYIGLTDRNVHESGLCVNPNIDVTFYFNDISQENADKYANEIYDKYWDNNDYFWTRLTDDEPLYSYAVTYGLECLDSYAVAYDLEYDASAKAIKSGHHDYILKIK